MKFIVLFILTISCSTFASQLTFITHNVEGKVYYQESGEMRGLAGAGRRAFYVELIQAMSSISGQPLQTIKSYPLKRAFATINTQPNIGLFSIARMPDREQKMKWVGPLQTTLVSLYQNADNLVSVKTLSDAKKIASICVINGSAHEKFLLDKGFVNLFPAKNHENCFKMLETKRVYAAVIGKSYLPEILDLTGISFANIVSSLTLYKTDNYLALSKEVPDEIVQHWQQALDKLKASGRYQALANRYLKPWVAANK